MDDWQDAAFSARHMHNRVGRSGKSKHSKPFDVRRTFGSYSVKCAAWQKALSARDDVQPEQTASLEIYRLTENGEGLVGELSLPGVLHAAVILAASRQSLRRTVHDLESVDIDSDKAADSDTDDQEQSDSITNEEEPGRDRFETFEKNSFRSPKFWLQWSGVPTSNVQEGSGDSTSAETGLGYIVFTGNDCRKFKGTINCSSLQWKDASLTGHKSVSRSESDAPVNWIQSGL